MKSIVIKSENIEEKKGIVKSSIKADTHVEVNGVSDEGLAVLMADLIHGLSDRVHNKGKFLCLFVDEFERQL